MLYPVYVHRGDAEHAHGVTIPDFAGCFAAADTWNELPKMIQVAVELYCEGEEMVLPEPSSLEALVDNPEYQDGMWMLVDVNVSRLNPRAVRLNVSLPESLLKRIDEEARSRHMSRSAFLAMAAQKAMQTEEST